jgi:hypothetical protein
MMEQVPGAGNTPLWEVYKVEDVFGPASLGSSNRTKRVYFHVLGAEDSYVDMALPDFTAPKVAAAIEAHVGHIIDVSQLKGQMF